MVMVALTTNTKDLEVLISFQLLETQMHDFCLLKLILSAGLLPLAASPQR